MFYAPWIHERIVCRSDAVIDSVFYLVNVDQQKDITIYAYYLRYSKDSGAIPVMSAISDGRQEFRFSCRKPKSLWDDEQWSGAYAEGSIPDAFQTKETDTLIRCISEDLPAINRILAEVRDPDRPSA